MRDFNEIAAFLAVAREGGFTAAANKLGQPKSYLSRKVSELEDRLQLRLLNRTTRSLSLTDDGRRYFEICKKAYNDIEDIEKDLEHSLDNPSGHLRVTCPVEFGPLITKNICRNFLIKYPNIQLEIFPTNSVIDIVRDQFDVAIRPAHLAEQDMISIPLSSSEWSLYASPLWVSHNPKVKKLENLTDNKLIAFNPSGKIKPIWKINKIKYNPVLVAGNLATSIEAAVQGVGVALLPSSLIQQELKEKKLVSVLKKWKQKEEKIYALYSSRQNMSSRLRVFLDYLREHKFY